MSKKTERMQRVPRSKIHFPKFFEVVKVVILVIITTGLASGFFYGINLLSSMIMQEILRILI